jgi:apolipoprotein N-acyltransferase
LRVVLGVGLSVLSPFCLVWALPPTGVWPLVFVALVPMLIAQHRLLPEAIAGLAPCLTVGLLVVLLAADAVRPVPGVLYGLAVFLGGAELVIGWIDRRLQIASGYRWFVVAAPLVIVGADVAQGSSAVASTWAYPAYALFAHRSFVEPVSVFTTDGLDLLILASNYALAQFVIGRVPLRRAGYWTLGVVLVWAAWLGYGRALAGDHATGRAVTVAAVQVPSGALGQARGELSALTREAADRGARLVVWPEEALFAYPAYAPASLMQAGPPTVGFAQQVARTDHVFLVTGLAAFGRNEAVTIAPSGQVLATYEKQHPVILSLGGEPPSAPVPVIRTPLGHLAMIICYDLDFLDTARQAAMRGAGIVAVPSGDWGQIASLHYTHLVFRAVENNLTMIKADGGFDSAIIDPQGRVLAHTASYTARAALLVSTVRPGTGSTVSQSLEPWFAPGALVLGLLLYGLMLVSSPRPGAIARPARYSSQFAEGAREGVRRQALGTSAVIWIVALGFAGIIALLVGTSITSPSPVVPSTATPTVTYVQQTLENALGRAARCSYRGQSLRDGRVGIQYTCYTGSGTGLCAGDQQYRVLFDPVLRAVSYGYAGRRSRNEPGARCPLQR